MINIKSIRIAVDFDGTIVEHDYPGIGKEKLFAFQTLKELEKLGARLILWTFRNGGELEEAVEFCKQNGIEFYAVNRNYPEEVYDDTISRKIDADIYIDDKNLGGFPGWSEVWQILVPFDLHQKEMEKQIAAARKSSLRRLFGKKDKQNED
jgi:hydroxymethylpyrimidine pyrophosphatase-like HAD family hydrolase